MKCFELSLLVAMGFLMTVVLASPKKPTQSGQKNENCGPSLFSDRGPAKLKHKNNIRLFSKTEPSSPKPSTPPAPKAYQNVVVTTPAGPGAPIPSRPHGAANVASSPRPDGGSAPPAVRFYNAVARTTKPPGAGSTPAATGVVLSTSPGPTGSNIRVDNTTNNALTDSEDVVQLFAGVSDPSASTPAGTTTAGAGDVGASGRPTPAGSSPKPAGSSPSADKAAEAVPTPAALVQDASQPADASATDGVTPGTQSAGASTPTGGPAGAMTTSQKPQLFSADAGSSPKPGAPGSSPKPGASTADPTGEPSSTPGSAGVASAPSVRR